VGIGKLSLFDHLSHRATKASWGVGEGGGGGSLPSQNLSAILDIFFSFFTNSAEDISSDVDETSHRIHSNEVL
jgi:hypothetical protein